MQLLVGEVMRNAASVCPDATAATLDDASMTFGEIEERANSVGHDLRERGVRHGDRVLWFGPTTLDAIPLFSALAHLGAVFAPVNPQFGRVEAEAVLAIAAPRLVVAAEGLEDVAWAPDAVSVESLGSSTADPVHEPDLAETDPHVVFFTSGSTGAPKGVVCSHRTSWLRTSPTPTSVSGGAGTVCMFPLFHMAGWTIALGAWQSRQATHFVATPDAVSLLETAQRHRARRMYCIPAVWQRLLDHGTDGYDLSALEVADTGTSATPPELLAGIRAALPHAQLHVFYGSTEAGPTTQLADHDVERKPGSVGIAQPNVEIRLTDDEEVCVRSPFLMDGYLDDPDATDEALRDGWYHTGDRGVLDAQGYLSIVGRMRDIIRTGGESVAPIEVEQALRTHPAIEDVAVVGVPDPRWGEIVCAVVVAVDPDTPPTLDALVDHVAALAPHKRPRRLELAESLPRTAATGQVQRTLLVERLQTGG